jgi:RNA polymerase sigma factor (sigma-70 family)
MGFETGACTVPSAGRVGWVLSVGLEQTWSPALRLRPRPVRAQAARHDADVFASVYEQHHRALYRYCRSLLGNAEDARDALQSTMAKALAALRDEERDFELRPWLFRIAHNEAVSRLRARRETVHLDAAGAVAADSLPQAIEDRERIALLRTDLLDLPERQRAALVLRELCGLGHEEIATVLDMNARAVKQTIFEAREALHQCAEGRAMVCAEVQQALSDGDGRVLRSRRMRAHVRSCRACRRFKAELVQRPRDLSALVPALPAGGGLLAQLLGGLEAGGAVSTVGGGAAATLAAKAALIAATAVTVAGAATVVRSAPHPAPAPAAAATQPAAAPARAVHAPMRTVAAPAAPHGTAKHCPARHRAPVHHAPAPARPAAPVGVVTPAPTAQSRPATAPAKHAAKPMPPGQANKQDTPATSPPPGQAKKQDTATATATLPSGQAKKQDTTAATLPPGQARKQDSADAAAEAVPPGLAKK